ncbi:HlyD family type I secretion periplasmic adaptor subunit [uncultured Roseobacter sp.]|uniref:HlyD family type I secretion periplasmic adaptor subunit n=1 Tax=uncultured Roseobacter sp. TaxID=114847 RepID=UPI002621AC03|nr:HlyD family type I secretion periplasmic adaptor subunit [uncultured Roseobacter sp.]
MTRLIPNRPTPDILRLEDYNRVLDQPADTGIGRFVIFGMLVMACFIGGSVFWAQSSKLDGAVVAPASLVVEGNRKTVEHLDGGIIRSILVADGDFVEAGQTLLELDSTDLDVDVNVLGNQLGDLLVRRARLLAQINGADSFVVNETSEMRLIDLPQQEWAAAYLTQRQLFDAEKRARTTEAEILSQRITSLKDQVAGLEEQRASNARQLDITRMELGNLQSLQEKGLVAAARVNARRIEIERLSGLDASLRTQQAQATNQIGELQLTGLSQQKLREEAIAVELAAVEAQLALVEPQFLGASERLKRVVVIAPASGHVVGMTVFTTGGVVRPGTPILEIVPKDDPLVIEARVNTTDIEKLHIGQKTRVRLSAFDQGDIPEANGRIVDISADSLEDDRTGDPYFVARVKLDTEQPDTVADLELLPGMPADLFVNTGEKTVLSYLTQPLKERLARTFIE